ncbi:MAG TPA: N-6 DNA methylase [Tepidisphaeraceae bacterium]|nr:N-6 DNA methylase [Tepidisphaeraceae bacterium]
MIDTLAKPVRRKALGAFYTPDTAAGFMATWAIRSPQDSVVDPSSGGGVFLRAAAERLAALGGNPSSQVWGVELDPSAHDHVRSAVARDYGLDPDKLVLGNFFDIAGRLGSRFDAVIGNPPYIRYQAFAGPDRLSARRELAKGAVELSELASAWAPFVVRSTGLLRDGGRLAMVLPMELFHAGYAKRVLAHLAASFRAITLVTFKRRLFPDLSQDTLLLLADGRSGAKAELRVKEVEGLEDLAKLGAAAGRVRGARRVSQDVLEGRARLLSYLLPPKARTLYDELRRSAAVVRVSSLADVGIGYVTGGNDFFHLSPADTVRHGVPPSVLRRAVFRGRAFAGTEFDECRWREASETGDAGYLLAIPPTHRLSEGLLDLVRDGEARGVHEAYKCRVRSPWFSVPHVHVPDAFLTYMSGLRPSLVVNRCDAVAPNTLHIVRMLPLACTGVWNMALSWRSSLTQLSVEIEGHAMGGGLLKLEPGEAANVLVAKPGLSEPQARQTCELVDTVSDRTTDEIATDVVDQKVLQDALGLSTADCKVLREAARQLRDRRYRR